MHTPRLARQLIATALIAVGTLAMVPAHSVQPVQANAITGPNTQGICQRLVINPRLRKLLCKLIRVLNRLNHLPIIVIILPDGFIEFLGTNVHQLRGNVDIDVQDEHDLLVRINRDGSFTVIDGKNLDIDLDGKPHFAVVSRLLLPFSAVDKGRAITVGEGTFENVPKGTTIKVAVGGRITFSSPLTKPAHVDPLHGFVLQIQVTHTVNHKTTTTWQTVRNDIIPAGAVARFAAA